MEKSLLEYDKNLEDLERQREKLEIVMQRMGQEWEESGAGVGWLGSLDLPATSQEIEIPLSPILPMNDIHVPDFSTTDHTATIISTPNTAHALVIEDESIDESLPANPISPPLFSNILLDNSGPSPEYLQSLLNVNEALLAQSLANTTPMLTPIDERIDEPMLLADNESNKINSLLITPQDTPDLKEVHSEQHDYILTTSTNEPETEVVISSLSEHTKITKSTSINNNNSNNNINNDQDPVHL